MTDVYFRFSPDVLRRLGEELNPTPDAGIVELVKNSYDADARSCRVSLHNTTQTGGSISIRDDGDGMDADTIRDAWLLVGRSSKSASASTRLGRIPAGNKGLGRLAALRLGSSATLITRPRTNPTHQLTLDVDWQRLDKADVVEEVPFRIVTTALPDSVAGTEITLHDVASRLTRLDVKRLARALLLLADPFSEDKRGFLPVLEAPEFQDLATLVERRYFDEADFHLTATLDADGRASARVTDYRGGELFSAGHDDIASNGTRSYEAANASLDFWAFILAGTGFAMRPTTVAEVRQWLQAFGGVHLYHNCLRVNPYGNPGDDWLGLNLRRAQSPEERPSTNTSIGRLAVHGDAHFLVEKTDRSGFVEGETFLELKRFCQDALEWMARRRLEHAEKRRRTQRTRAEVHARRARKELHAALETVPQKARDVLLAAVSTYDKARNREVTGLRREVDLYRTLSTAGITAATFAHESAANPVKVITHATNTIARRGRKVLGSRYEQFLQEPVALVHRSLGALRVLGAFTLSLTEGRKRRRMRVDVHPVILQFIGMFRPFSLEREVDVSPALAPGNPYLRATEASLESMLANFLNNSFCWFERASTPARRVVISTQVNGNTLTMRVQDNGPGISGIALSDIWLPGQTTRPDGTGLGLTIVRDCVADLGGTVEAVAHGILGGAEFVVTLPLLGS